MSGVNVVQILNFAEMVEYQHGGIVSRQITNSDSGNVTLFAFDSGQRLSEHTAPFDALVQIIEGKAEVIISGKSYILESGEAIIMPAGFTHALNAVDKFKMLLTMIRRKE